MPLSDRTSAEAIAAGVGTPLQPSDPTRLGSYILLRRLGRGGMGDVYLARTGRWRLVAVKVIKSDIADNPAFRARFRKEAATARRVARFCTAEVLDADPDAAQPYLVTEYVEGPTLEALVNSGGPLPPGNLERLAVGVGAALTAIHGAGVVHQDLKPGNVLISPFGPRVIDFGIARSVDTVTRGSLELRGIGTPAFMAPEQARGEAVTAAADIFAWGGVVAFAGTGQPPFGNDDLRAIIYRAARESPRLEGLDPTLRPVVEWAMSKDPMDRPSATELLWNLLDSPPAKQQAAVTEVLDGWASAPAAPVPHPGPRPRPQTPHTHPPPTSARPPRTRPPQSGAPHLPQTANSAPTAFGRRPGGHPPHEPAGVDTGADVARTDVGRTDVAGADVAGADVAGADVAGADAEQGEAWGAHVGRSEGPPASAHRSAGRPEAVPASSLPPMSGTLPGPGRPEQPRPRRHPPRRRLVAVAAAVLSVLATVVAAFIVLSSNPDEATASVMREPVSEPGPNPFLPPVGMDQPGVEPPNVTETRAPDTPSASPPSSPSNPPHQTYPANTEGLYGGTPNRPSCDTGRLADLLRRSPDRASAWSGVLGLKPEDITGYIRTLTPIILRTDTLVTNHRLVGRSAVEIPAVLQAGTAVLVDVFGRPVTKCNCGNPLTAPTASSNPVYVGPTWDTFSASGVTVIESAPGPVKSFTLVDPSTMRPFTRPSSTTGEVDKPYTPQPTPTTPTPTHTTPTPTPSPASAAPTPTTATEAPPPGATTSPSIGTTPPPYGAPSAEPSPGGSQPSGESASPGGVSPEASPPEQNAPTAAPSPDGPASPDGAARDRPPSRQTAQGGPPSADDNPADG